MDGVITKRIVLKASSILVLTFLSFTRGFAQSPAPLTLEIQIDKPLHRVSPTLYGLMTEEINYSYDGGLYAEMVRNRTFRARRRDVPYWLLVEGGNAQAKMEIGQQTGPSEALHYSLSLEAT